MQIDFHEEYYNPAFRPLIYDDADHIVLRGGAGSGKSHYVGQEIVRRLMKLFAYRAVGIRKVANFLRESVFSQVQDTLVQYDFNGNLVYDLRPYFKINKTILSITCIPTDSEIIFLGIDDPEKIKSLKKIDLLWFEEATELTEEDYRQFSLRLRGIGSNKLQQIFSFNPVDESSWVKKEFYPNQAIDDELYSKMDKRINKYQKYGYSYMPNYRDIAVRMVKNVSVRNKVIPMSYSLTNFTYDDNFFLDDVYKARLENLKNQNRNLYDIYCRSRWGSIGHRIFNPPFPILSKFPEEYEEVIYGIDFGYHHPSALVQVGILDGAYYVKELLHETQLTNAKLIETILQRNLIPDYRKAVLYGDSAVPSFLEEFEEAGFYIKPAYKPKDSVEKGIDFMQSAEIYSHKDNVNFNQEVRTYCWQLDKDGKPIKKPTPINDDLISATRYAVWTHKMIPKQHFGIIDISDYNKRKVI